MINNEIIAIKDSILSTLGDECEKIFLFGSYAYGDPHKDSDYDFYVVLKDGIENPLLVMERINRNLYHDSYVPIDVLANYKSCFEQRSVLPTLERAIARDGVVLYERT